MRSLLFALEFASVSSALKNPLKHKTIRGARITMVLSVGQIAASQPFNSAWTP